MTDIVERLRARADFTIPHDPESELYRAADTIESLREALDHAREWIAHDDAPMGPAETALHRRVLAQIDAALSKVSEPRP